MTGPRNITRAPDWPLISDLTASGAGRLPIPPEEGPFRYTAILPSTGVWYNVIG